ncbi:MAG: hypothetical protein WBC51_04935 [Vicinamibacterales bacterium]
MATNTKPNSPAAAEGAGFGPKTPVSEMYTQHGAEPPLGTKNKNQQVYFSESEESLSKSAPSLADLEKSIDGLLRMKDRAAFRILLAAVAAHRLSGAPVWLLIVGPSSGAKTELIQTLNLTAGVYPLSDLTEKTFASGAHKTGGGDASLLTELGSGLLSLKDFTTVLSMRSEKRKEILGQLREIYDGEYRKNFGSGKRFEWKGRITLVAGVTHEIDKHYEVMSALGQRFLLLRFQQPDRIASALQALDSNLNADPLRDELKGRVALFFDSLPYVDPTLSPDSRQQLVEIAEFSTRARSAVVRNGYTRQFEYTPDDPEGPGRFVKQLHGLARGLAVIERRTEISAADMTLVARVAFDSLPTIRRLVVRDFADCVTATVNDLIKRHKNTSESSLRRAVDDLVALDVVEELPPNPDGSQVYRLVPQYRRLLRRVTKT